MHSTAVRAETVREPRLGVLTDVVLERFPFSRRIADLFAEPANRQNAGELLDEIERVLQIAVRLLQLFGGALPIGDIPDGANRQHAIGSRERAETDLHRKFIPEL